MRVCFNLLADSHDERASPWDGGDCVMMRVAKDGRKRYPVGRSTADEVLVWVRELNRFYVPTQRGIDIDRRTIVACVIEEKSQRRLGLALVLLQGQVKFFVREIQMCLGLQRGIRKWDGAPLSRRCSLPPQEVCGKHQETDQ